ncbi:transposable element Tcb2 transposase [Trichonephila clavipes]|nr:transposable element Tcb2 transposase [Trichonephila clavipes]
MEHVWDFLGRRLAARTLPPVTIRELRLALKDEWAVMPQQLIDTLILSMGRRFINNHPRVFNKPESNDYETNSFERRLLVQVANNIEQEKKPLTIGTNRNFFHLSRQLRTRRWPVKITLRPSSTQDPHGSSSSASLTACRRSGDPGTEL